MDVRVEEPFFARPARVVAQALLGLALVRRLDGVRLAGRIVETEAYCDAEALDRACHGAANQGRPTARTALMFGPSIGTLVFAWIPSVLWIGCWLTGLAAAGFIVAASSRPPRKLDSMKSTGLPSSPMKPAIAVEEVQQG